MIELDTVRKVYGEGPARVEALGGVSCAIRAGEFVAICGPSGSGKTTLMHILGCLDRPTAGTYRLEGTDVTGLSDDALAALRNRRIGFVFQTFHLLPRMTAVHNVELPLVYSGTPRPERARRAARALEAVGLAHRVAHLPNALSGGEQQRVAIARALVNAPTLLLADEPTGNLDSRAGEEVLGLFEGLWGQGATLVLVTHNPRVAARARRVLFMADGQITAEERRGDGAP